MSLTTACGRTLALAAALAGFAHAATVAINPVVTALQAAMQGCSSACTRAAVSGVVGPGHLQADDVRAVDLLQAGVAHARDGSAVSRPVARCDAVGAEKGGRGREGQAER